MQTHTLPERLDHSGLQLRPESSALWALNEPRNLVVFVHGYTGRAVDTWGAFRDLIPGDANFLRSDIVFLGYESFTRSAAFNAGLLYRAITALAEDYPRFIRTSGAPRRRRAFGYRKIVLVGHSLGGVLVRDVAMSAAIEEKPWARKVSLMLFAPAHMGANIIDLVRDASGLVKWLGLARAAAQLTSPCLKDLAAGSIYLSSLLSRAETIGEHSTTKAKIVVHGSNDRIVVHVPFYKDPPCRPYVGHGHVSCCKPIRGSFVTPVTDLTELL